MDAQKYVDLTNVIYAFSTTDPNNYYNPGLCSPFTNGPFNTNSTRIISIPPALQNIDFKLYVQIGMYYKSYGAFKYIQPTFL
jgi:hypothetical protein